MRKVRDGVMGSSSRVRATELRVNTGDYGSLDHPCPRGNPIKCTLTASAESFLTLNKETEAK